MSGNVVYANVVVIEYSDLLNDNTDLGDQISEAFGPEGLGILSVKGISNLPQLRERLLHLAHKFASLPESTKEKYVHNKSFYSFGWSHGKEMLEGGKLDYSKGSFYNNPLFDVPFDDPQLIEKYPSFCHPNIWPKEDLPDLQPAFLEMGKLVVEVGLLLSKHCDKYIRKKCSSYQEFKLRDIIQNSKTSKARLLHYFPLTKKEMKDLEESGEEGISNWCGWHNDHGSLTGLLPAMYINAEGNEVPNPDPKSGLYIRSRSNQIYKAGAPADHLIFQIGETAQIHSGGILQATPHCVRGALGEKAEGVSRETFAVFMEPMMFEKMDVPTDIPINNVTEGTNAKSLPPKVPALSTRWAPKMNFAEFSEATLKAYHAAIDAM